MAITRGFGITWDRDTGHTRSCVAGYCDLCDRWDDNLQEGICPECLRKYHVELADKDFEEHQPGKPGA